MSSTTIRETLHRHPSLASVVVLLAAIGLFTITAGPRFLDPFNMSLVLQQVTVIGILAVAQTLVILTAGIDLSVGAIMVLSTVIMGRVAVDVGLPAPVALTAGVTIACACGAINGTLVSRLKLPPFIVTLGTWNVFLALNLWVSRSQTIRAQDLEASAQLLQTAGNAARIGTASVTLGSIVMVATFLLAWYALTQTGWGRHVYATGDNPTAAELAGVRPKRVLFSVYVAAGLLCALAGWALIGRIGSVSPQAGATANLDSITAVVIGGTSLFGGRGSVFGSLVGALIVGVLRNGLALSGVQVLWQEFAVGLLIIVAVATDQWIRRA